jgi:hypothetical protein
MGFPATLFNGVRQVVKDSAHTCVNDPAFSEFFSCYRPTRCSEFNKRLGFIARPSHLFEEAPLACLKSQELNDNDMVEAMGESICRVSRY